ncbi:hypothetical protein [Pseudoalteromonas sp.]|uniref:hypothetical protein n=1 Tax=Pseudoalteromonas sp. TaxID=53249 RepID=UPI00356A3621
MSELQNDSVESEEIEIESAEIENQEDGAELAPASESEHEEQPKVEDEVAKQEAIQKAINKKHFEAQQAKRDLEAANKRIEEFEARQREEMAAQVGNIPPAPDPFDDDYDEKIRERDELIARKAQFDAQQSVWQQQQQTQQQQAQQLKQEQLQAQVQAYNARTKELGISPDELQAAGNTVAQYGISDDLTMAILADSDGPLITKYLAANPMELSSLSNMNPLQGAMHIERIVRAKATALKPKTSKAPNPSENLQGKGHKPDDGRYRNIKGAKFE